MGWGCGTKGTGGFPNGAATHPRCTSVEPACSIRGERGEQMPPCPIMHALLSQWIRPVKRLAAAKSNLIQKTFFFFLHKDEAQLCRETKTNILRSPPLWSNLVYLCAPGSYANSSSCFKISLSLALMDLFLICCRHRPHLLKGEKYQPLHSRSPRSPGPAWQWASLLLVQPWSAVTLPLNSLEEEFNAGFALSQPLASCQRISLS